MKKINSKVFLRTFILIMLGFFTIGTVLSSSIINSSAHNAYFLAITIDEGSFRYVPTVVYEENDWVANNHRESDLGDFTSKTVKEDSGEVLDFTVPLLNYEGESAMSDSDVKKAYEELIKGGDGDRGLAFTFPGLHSRGFSIAKRHANGNDEQMAYFISEHLVGSLNDTLSWMTSKAGGYNKFTPQSMKLFSADLANKADTVVNRGGGSKTIKLGEGKSAITFTLKKATSEDVKNGNVNPIEKRTTLDDYLAISTPDGETKYVLAKVNKGYQDREDIPSEYKEGLKKYGDPIFLNWQYIVLQGNHSADVKNITFSSVSEIVKPGAFEVAISSLLGSSLGGLRDLLGLYPMEDIMLNGGSRNVGYYYGVMPKAWMNSANLLNFICQILAWTIMGYAFVRMLFKRQLSTMNVGERVSLMEGIKDILLTCFLLAGFALVFHSMIRINYALVDVFEASSEFSSYIGKTTTMSSGILASIIINFAFFVINAYFNFMYVLRAFTVAILYGIAPLAIVTISFGGKYKVIFSNYMKELVANIFLQTFHAMCVAFFTSVTATSQMRTFELFAVLYAFIPLTNFIRQNIIGLPGGITDQASGLMSMARGVTTGAIGGLAGAKASGKGSAGVGLSGTGVNSNISRNISENSPANTSFMGKMRDNSSGTPQMKNSELRKDMEGAPKGGTSRQIAGRNGGKAVLSGLAKTAGSVASAGLSVGFGAIGDSRGMEKMASSTQNLMGGAKNSFHSAFSSPELGDAGAKELYKSHENSTMVMDDKFGKFNNSGLNDSVYEDNFNEMSDCFLQQGVYDQDGEKGQSRERAIKYYKSQGIEGVSRNNKGNTVIGFSNEMYSKKNFSLKNVGNIAIFDSQKE